MGWGIGIVSLGWRVWRHGEGSLVKTLPIAIRSRDTNTITNKGFFGQWSRLMPAASGVWTLKLLCFFCGLQWSAASLSCPGENGKLFVAEICRLCVLKVGKDNSLGHG
ncbi:uncharacterized protein LOC127794882 [Diospyros lotus]|uniref:uncharacterized protein LOC127794882 n=1 Tax=Diospyros lotus TaxID=55363 RepID=UPI00224FABCD|nr:uncharacterized protein LOC127794882 [Diospyros lotus]